MSLYLPVKQESKLHKPAARFWTALNPYSKATPGYAQASICSKSLGLHKFIVTIFQPFISERCLLSTQYMFMAFYTFFFYYWATTSYFPKLYHEWVSEWVKSLSRVWHFVTPLTVAHQAPLSMGFSRQEYWSGLPFPSPGNLPDPGIKPRSPALQTGALTSEPPGKPIPWWNNYLLNFY